MDMEKYVVTNKRYEMVPPDGGWGYMICVAAIINYSVMSMFLGSFGTIYKEFIEIHHMGSTQVSLLGGSNMMLAAIAGYFTSSLLIVLSVRKVALIASFLLNIGIFGTIFINTVTLLFVCQGLQSIGVGIIYTTTCTLINDYFLKKQLLAVSLTQSFSAVGAMVAPYLVKVSLDSYGYRGTLIMISAINLQSFIAVALMQPVDRHLIKVESEVVTDELKSLIKPAMESPVSTPTITVTDTDLSFEAKTIDKGQKGSKNFFSEIFDLPVWRKFLLSNASMGPTYCMFAETIFALLLPQALDDWHFNQEEVARAVSLASFGDVITRVLFVFTSKWLSKLGSQEVYVASVFLAFVARILMLWSENTTAIMFFITIIGVARCCIAVMPPVIFAVSFGSENFTKVLGIFMLMLGIMDLVLGLAVGAIRDLTNSYNTAFYVLTSCYAVVVLLWIVELVYKRNKHRRVAQRAATEKLKNNVTNKIK